MNQLTFWFRKRSPSFQTLSQQVTTYRIGLDEDISAAGDAETAGWVGEVVRLLDEAEKALHPDTAGDVPLGQGWWCFLAAKRAGLEGLTERQLEGEAEGLRQEALTKLGGWRRATVLQILGEPGSSGRRRFEELPRRDKREAVEAAMLNRDENSQNEYRRNGALRRQIFLIGVIVALAILGLVLYSGFRPLPLDGEGRWQDVVLVVLFGLLGGAMSSLIPLGRRGGRFPERLATWYVTAVRPVLGAASGLASSVLLQAGFLTIEVGSVAVLAVAFAAGFSERLILRAVFAVAGGDGPQEGRSKEE